VLGLLFWFFAAVTAVLAGCAAQTVIYTSAPQLNQKPGERFPAGAMLRVRAGAGPSRALVPLFAASADATVSFDAKRVLFAGKRKAGDPWQIWEVALAGGTPQRVTSFPEDCIRPFYLPENRIVYARRTGQGYQIEVLARGADGERTRLTYRPGDHIPTDVLRDGRVLFEAPHPAAVWRDIYAVYTDGSGVEAYRCQHNGRDSAREFSSGDIVFVTGGRLARFTSSLAVQTDIPLPEGQFEGTVAEIGPGEWIGAYRPTSGPFALYRMRPGGAVKRLGTPEAGNEIDPVVVAPRAVPPQHPSSLGNREGANLLCLSVYTSRERMPAAVVEAVRLYTQNASGASALLGEAKVARDGSFYVQVPSERPLRFELIDRERKVVRAEKGWFWTRQGEQRVCVGCHAGPERAPDNAVPQTLLDSTTPTRLMPAGQLDKGTK